MNRMKKNRKTALIAALLALCLLCLPACQGEEPSSSLTAVASTSATPEAAGSQITETTPTPAPTAAPTPAPTAAPTPSPTPVPTATPQPTPEPTAFDVLQNGAGEFSYAGLEMGMPLSQVEEALALMGEGAPQLELVEEREDRHFGVTIALYRLGATQLLDRQFAWELVFWDEQLHSISLTLEEGEDLAAFYQELEEGLADRFGLEDFSQVDLQSPLTLPSGAAYDQVNTSMAASDSGETTLTLTGLFQGDALVQLGLSLAANENG